MLTLLTLVDILPRLKRERGLDCLRARHASEPTPPSKARKATPAHAPGQNVSLAAIEPELKKAVQENPQSFEANHNLGELYIQMGQLTRAISYLESARRINPSHYINCYDLALAYLETRNFAAARHEVEAMLKQQDKAELHNLLGEVEENSGNFVQAANEYQLAFRMEPTEQNTFDWACELLIHNTFGPAIKVFRFGVVRYPNSARLWIGLGISLYSRGSYDDAVGALLRATDLNTADPRPYIFLAIAYNYAEKKVGEVAEHLKRFTETNPNNAQAFYYYALTLWKGGRSKDLQASPDQIHRLLDKSISLDPKFPDAHLQLGILYEDQRLYPEAIEELQRAIKLEPELADAHYRLGRIYARIGQKDRAREEFELHERFTKEQTSKEEKARADMRLFVYSTKGSSPPTQ